MPNTYNEQAPVPPPSYSRAQVQAQAQRARALHINALTLIETLHLLALCRLAVQVAHRRCPPPLPKGAGGRPRTYRDESFVLIALLKTLWRLSYQDMHDWLVSWPAFPGLWPASERARTPSHSEQITAVQTSPCCWSTSPRVTVCAYCSASRPLSTHRSPRSHH